MTELVDVERRKAVISVLKDWLVGGDHLILKWEPFADEILAALRSANTVRPEGIKREAIAKIIRQELWDEQNSGRDAEACADRAAERILALRPNDQPGEREAIIDLIRDRREVRRFFGRRSIDKSCGEVVHVLEPDGPIGDDSFKVIERIDHPNFLGEQSASERAAELADEYTANAILALRADIGEGEGRG